MTTATNMAGATAAPVRDERIDVVRGLALMMIFIDHIGGNPLGRVTLHALGFADAAEVFVFLAGYSAVLAFLGAFERREALAGSLRIFRRVRELYGAHILLFVAVTAVCGFAAIRLGDPSYLEDMGLDALTADPVEAIVRMVTLTFQPNFLDILPLYVLLLSALPAIFLASRLHWSAPLAASVALYGWTLWSGFNLPNYPAAKTWFFNPFAWQLIFVLGVTAALLHRRGALERFGATRLGALITIAAAAYVFFAFLVAAPWRSLPGLTNLVAIPPTLLPPIDKTTLSPFRVIDLLAKAWLFARLVPPGARLLGWSLSRALSECGRRSLEVYSVGIVLSIVATIALREIGYTVWTVALVNFVGFGILLSVARVATLAGELAERRPSSRSTPPLASAERGGA